MKGKFYTSKIAIIYNFYGNQKVKAKNIKSKNNYKKELKRKKL